jgi:ribonuclease-3
MNLPVALDDLQQSLGVRFKDPQNLRAAFVHESYAHESTAEISNERLEFLGDAVLGLVTSELLYERFPDLREGELTRMKAALVSRVSLAEHARALGLGQALLLGRGGEVSGGRERTSLLANVFEAVVGALYLDSGYEAAHAFLRRRFAPLLSALPTSNRDYKSLLQQATQRYYKSLPSYRVVSESGPAHARNFEVEVAFDDRTLGHGSGTSKKEAQQNAARQALERFNELMANAADDE